jgi:hypothetical protein
VSIFYFGLFNPSHWSPNPMSSQLPFFNSFQYISLYPLPSLMRFTILLILYYILFSFPWFPKYHRVVPLLQTCSTYEFAYDHVCFCIHVYLWIYRPHMRENIWPLSFWAWFTSLNMMSSNCIHLLSNHISLFLVTE